MRPDRRTSLQLRPVSIRRGFTRSAQGSVLFEMGRTRVLCTASVEEAVPEWREDSGLGWVTAEYDMLPASTGQRRKRNRAGTLDGRTQEIQRLIGRCMRGVVDMAALGPRTIWIDCDVIEADGGTRTAGVNGAYVAMTDAVADLLRRGLIARNPIRDTVTAVSVGVVDGRVVLDLCYEEDKDAEVDFNVAQTGDGRFIEVQGSAEGAAFDRRRLDRMLSAAARGIRELRTIQTRALRRRPSASG